jgi:hypothetical protein
MRMLKSLAVVLGLVIAAIGAVGLVAPTVLLDLGRSLHTANALYIVAAVRVMFGAVLLLVASVSRTPRVLRVLGAFIVIAGLFTPFFGVERSRAMFDWWSARGSLFTRAWAMVAVAFGLFIVSAVISPRRSAT